MRRIRFVLAFLLPMLLISGMLVFGRSADISLKDLDLSTLSETKPMFTITALSRFNGKSNNPAYVSVGGSIFDLSSLRLWSTGSHMALHSSGQELTYELKVLSPHKESKTANLESIGLLVVTLDELRTYDGKNGKKSYVAVDGKVYDFSRLNRWPNGSHQRGMHLAGSELTSELRKDSPHGVSRISGVEAVAILGITIDELKEMDGQDGRKGYVAAEGMVYDVTELSLWRNGSHQGQLHTAGQELTKDIVIDSPHGTTKLEKAYLVGLLVFTREQLSRFNGIEEMRELVAYNGCIYDVSDLESWEMDTGVEIDTEAASSEIELLEMAIKIGYFVID